MQNSIEKPPEVHDKSGRSVPAKWLTDQNGSFIINPTKNMPFIVPADFNFRNFLDHFHNAGEYANNFQNNIERSGFITGVMLGFAPGSQFDIQRSYNGTTPGILQGGDRFVREFTDAANFIYGAACSEIGITQNDCLQAGGLVKLATALSSRLQGNFSQEIGKSSDWFNPIQNAINIRLGYNFSNEKQATSFNTFDTILTPQDYQTRNNKDFIINNQEKDHSITVESGGKIWDAYILQKNNSDGFSNWNDFKIAVTASNPTIADLNKIDSGTKIYLPQHYSDGSITYNYSNGVSINTNSTTGEYLMTIPNSDGGFTIFERIKNPNGNYIVAQITTNSNGENIFKYTGEQNAITGEIKNILKISQNDIDGDGKIDQLVSDNLSNNNIEIIDSKNLNKDGGVKDETITTISADQNFREIKIDTNGDGQVDQFERIQRNADGTSTESDYTGAGVKTDVILRRADGSLADEAFYNTAGQETGEARFNATGQQTDFLVFDPNSGQEIQDQHIVNGQVVDALNYNLQGQLTDQAYYDASGHEYADARFNAAGQMTDAIYFNAAGQIAQDQQLDPVSGRVVAALNYSDGVLNDQAFYNASQQLTGDARFNATGQQTDFLVFDPNSGQEIQDQHVVNGQVVDALNYNLQGQLTDQAYYDTWQRKVGDAVFNAQGQQTDFLVLDPNSGQVIQDQQFRDGHVAVALNYSNGQLIDEAFYDAAGHEYADARFNTAGQMTDAIYFNAAGQETQDQQFDPSTGRLLDVLNFSNGVETDEAFYDAAGHEVGDARFNSAGQETDYLVFNTAGQEIQDSQFNPTTGKEVARLLYDTSGQLSAALFFNSYGEETQDQRYVNGTLQSVTHFSNGYETDQATFNAAGQEISDAKFNPGATYAYEVDKFNAAGAQIERDLFNPVTGRVMEVDLWNGSSPYAYQRALSNGGSYFSEIDYFDPNTGVETSGATFNSQSGVELSYLSNGYWYAGGSYYVDDFNAGYEDAMYDCPDGFDPVVLNLHGARVQTQGLAGSSANFDRQNSGTAVQTGWVTAGEALLVFTPDAPDQAVTQEKQLVSGFEALRALDTHRDGVLNASDTAWQDLRLWIDADGSGQFKSGALYTLDQVGIQSIQLNPHTINEDSHGNTIVDDSSFTWTSGAQGEIAGVNLTFDSHRGQAPKMAPAVSSTDANPLIQAMAAFAPPAPAQMQWAHDPASHNRLLMAAAH